MSAPKTILVTGGSGFIGSAVIHDLIQTTDWTVVNLDNLTYAANPMSLSSFERHPRYRFEQADIRNAGALKIIFTRHDPDLVMHLAAESHVDRSIDGPENFIQTNVIGTFHLLEAARRHWDGLSAIRRGGFRFLHVSTDEVYGTLGAEGLFHEDTPYAPNSPYSASKASSDHLARAWSETYGLPVLISNCSNNYGPRQFPEKLIPVIILKSLAGEALPVYGAGQNVRDWLYVVDHAVALRRIICDGRVGECYNVGGEAERRNVEVVEAVCSVLDELRPRADGKPHSSSIKFVQDRPGHDARYAMSIDKIRAELGWQPSMTFEQGLRQSIQWYLDNEEWWRTILDGGYRTARLGLGVPASMA